MRRILTFLVRPWVIMPLIGIVALTAWWLLRGDAESGSSDEAVNAEQIVEASLGSVSQTVSAEGTIAYEETEDLSFSASGTVTAVNAVAGQEVTKGTVLAELDSPELEAAVAEAETAVAEAEATLADEQSAGASDTRLEASTSALATAEDRLAEAEQALEGTKLVASFDGTIATVDLTVGEELAGSGTGGTSMTGSGSGSGQSGPGIGGGDTASIEGAGQSESSSTSSATPHVQVVSAGRYVVEVGVDDTDISRVELGAEAEVSLSTSSSSGDFPGGSMPGGGPPGAGGFPGGGMSQGADTEQSEEAEAEEPASVVGGVDSVSGEVSTIADASSGVASYPVTVSFTDDSGDYNAGATVLVEFTYDERTDAVLVPAFAVTNEEGKSTVLVDVDGERDTRTVTTGATSGAMVEITSGLEAGESVVVTGPGGRDAGGQAPPGFGGAEQGETDDVAGQVSGDDQ